MGLFDKLFSSKENAEENELPWIDLTEVAQIQEIIDKSLTKTQIVFKHSTRCGISRMVKKQFISDYEFSENEVDLYYLDLIQYREVSNEVANTFDIVHESPQLLVIKNGIAVANDSHGSINDLDLKQFV